LLDEVPGFKRRSILTRPRLFRDALPCGFGVIEVWVVITGTKLPLDDPVRSRALVVEVLEMELKELGGIMLKFTVVPLYMSRPAARKSESSNAWWCAPANMLGPLYAFCADDIYWELGLEMDGGERGQ
jgi:hypothetical protein